MSIRTGQSVTIEFITSSFSTGAVTNADSSPSGTLVVNGVDNVAAVTITNVDTGRYKAAVTLPTLAIGDIAELSVAATVGGVAGKGIVWRDTKDVLLDSSGNTTFNNPSIGSVTGDIGGDVHGKVLGGGSSALSGVGIQADVEQWKGVSVPTPAVSGVPVVDVKYSAGTQIYNADGTLAGATSTTVTFPSTDSAGVTIPDDTRFEYAVLDIVDGAGEGQFVLLTTKSGAHTFSLFKTPAVALDNTSQYVVAGNWRSNIEQVRGVQPGAMVRGTVSGTPTTTNIPTSSLTPAATDTDQFKGRVLIFDADTVTVGLRGEATDITSSSSAGVLTVSTLSSAPVSGDTFTIV